jgi:hypothetical protein
MKLTTVSTNFNIELSDEQMNRIHALKADNRFNYFLRMLRNEFSAIEPKLVEMYPEGYFDDIDTILNGDGSDEPVEVTFAINFSLEAGYEMNTEAILEYLSQTMFRADA